VTARIDVTAPPTVDQAGLLHGLTGLGARDGLDRIFFFGTERRRSGSA
jgi:hypothetical protein